MRQPLGTGEPGKRSGFIDQARLGCGEPAVPRSADLHLDVTAGGRAGAREDLGAGHGDLDRPAGLAGQRPDDGFQVAAALALASEAAADLHGDDVDLPDGHAQDAAGVVAQGKVALAAGPDGHRVVGVPAGGGRVGLNVSLVDLAGVVLALHDDIGLGEAGLQVSGSELEVVGHVGPAGSLLGPAARALRRVGQGHQAFVNRRGAVGHGLLCSQDGRQNLPIHFNQRQGLLRQVGRVGGDGGDGVARGTKPFRAPSRCGCRNRS